MRCFAQCCAKHTLVFVSLLVLSGCGAMTHTAPIASTTAATATTLPPTALPTFAPGATGPAISASSTAAAATVAAALRTPAPPSAVAPAASTLAGSPPATPTTTVAATRSPETATAAAQIVDPTAQAQRTDAVRATAQAVAQGTPRPPTAPPAPVASGNPTVETRAARPVLTMAPTPPRSPVPAVLTPASLPTEVGTLVQVGKYRLWMACKGEGGPTVVMDAGVNSGSQIWQFVYPSVATTTRTCVYDRVNLGRSDRADRPRTSQEAVSDLHGLLVNAGIPAPYVLVAHSFGGLNVRLYQSEFPQEVVGMVLVDTVHEDRFAATAKVLTPQQEREFEAGRAGNPEGLHFIESSNEVRAALPPNRQLPEIPIVVIARGRAEPWPPGYPAEALERVWRDLQKDLAARAPQGKLLIAEQSDHNIPGEQPQIVIDATRRMVEQLRAGRQ